MTAKNADSRPRTGGTLLAQAKTMMMNAVVVDTDAICRRSRFGKEAAMRLELSLLSAQARADRELARAQTQGPRPRAAPKTQTDPKHLVLATARRREGALKRAIMERAAPIIRAIATERKATMVVEARAVLFAPAAADITWEVIRRLDVEGPMSVCTVLAGQMLSPAGKLEPPTVPTSVERRPSRRPESEPTPTKRSQHENRDDSQPSRAPRRRRAHSAYLERKIHHGAQPDAG